MSSEMDEERAGSFRKLPLLTIREYLTRYTTRQSTVTSSFTNSDIAQDQLRASSVEIKRNLKDLVNTSAMFQSSGKQQSFAMLLS